MKRRQALAILALAVAVAACGSSREPIEVRRASAGATPPGTTVGAAYMTLIATTDDALVGATTPVADSVEMHTSIETDGVMQMRPLPVVELKAGQPFAFAPGGAHFMLIGLHAPLVADSRFPLTLQFRNAGEIMVAVPVLPPGSATAH